MSKLVRVSDESYSKLNSITKATGISRQDILDAALKQWEKDTLLRQANDAYAAMQQNSEEWAEEQRELALWDVTLKDGLEDE